MMKCVKLILLVLLLVVLPSLAYAETFTEDSHDDIIVVLTSGSYVEDSHEDIIIILGIGKQYNPNMTTPIITPVVARTNSILNCTSTYTDLNGDVGNVSFRWYVNGDNIYNETVTSVPHNTEVVVSLEPSNFSINNNVSCDVQAFDGSLYSDVINSTNTTILGVPDTNFSIWNGVSWDDAYSYYAEFRCTENQTECEPTYQNVSNSQSIYQVCNNGTGYGTGIDFYINETCADIDLKCDAGYSYASSTIIDTSLQEIYSLDVSLGECIDISCWADYDDPSSGCYFDTYSNITY